MRDLQCSQCGVSAKTLVWGFVLLVQDGWSITPSTNPVGATERGWLCTACGSQAQSLARGLGRLTARGPRREGGPQRERKGRAPKVLVVDDHVLMLRSMVRMLSGCETVVTTSPSEALGVLLSGDPFDVVISDVTMPEISGPELYARCFAHSPDLARRFVFASADPTTAARLIEETVASVGAAQKPPLIRKPTSRAALMAAVIGIATSAPHRSGTYELRLPRDAQGNGDQGHALPNPGAATGLRQKRSSRQ